MKISNVSGMEPVPVMYLVDTNVISEARKQSKANSGVRKFFEQTMEHGAPIYLSAVTVGELRRGVGLIQHRGDSRQADRLGQWLDKLLVDYGDQILDLDADTAQVWGLLRVPHPENSLDKQIAATALIHGLTLVTRNEKHFAGIGVPILNPFITG